jgi:hypothetical protein
MIKFILMTLFILFSSLHAWPPIDYTGRPEYYMCSCSKGSNKWNVVHHGTNHYHGWNIINRVHFQFIAKECSWKDYLNDTNTYEDCLLDNAYGYLMEWGYCSRSPQLCSSYIFSDISSLKSQKYCKKDIPYIEGCWFNPSGCHSGFFRLYMFNTKDDKATFFLFVEIESFETNKKHEEIFNQPFRFLRNDMYG